MFKCTVTHLSHIAPCSIHLYPAIWVLAKGRRCRHCWTWSISSCGSWQQETEAQKQKTEKQMLEQACPSVSCMASVVCQEWDVPWRNLFRVVGKIIKYLCMSTILLKSLRFSWGSFWDHFFLCGGFLSISPLQGQQHCESQLDRAHGAQNQVGKCWTRCSETWFLIR